jgi:large subunit ribosomal protein L7/L12
VSEAFGVSAAAPVAAAGPAVAAGPAAPTVVSVILVSAGAQKVAVIKAYREATGLGLIDAKNAVEKGGVVIKDGIKPEEAEEVKKTFEAAGATVKIE